MIHARRAFDHIGFAVPDLDQAVDFFVDTFGFDVVITAGPYDDFGYVWPGEDAPEKGTLRQANLVLGDSFNVELLEYTNRTAPELVQTAPRPADRGGWHLCMHVDDIHAASRELTARDDTESISEIIREEGDPMDGLLWAYFRTSWGLVLELIQWQPGMPYERTTSLRMAPPRWAPA
ncbi:VOC family protein [Gordonia polyisoprenivorans]|uniref:VOC family protein n=1 Tax=Gordonia polyisoprenivorans TaxID=84595 RepID=UPI001A0E14F9|nr:VOC family protein [Gordonia polyisoprenivorans]MBE7191110.1 VOC family protein [Gordonia polyisoprenivorans]QUD83597.1 VOC family protein [Gordonia polyisoprenivorans]UZF55440.1 VOC family protein [Gordonia polyisoprenivorans]